MRRAILAMVLVLIAALPAHAGSGTGTTTSHSMTYDGLTRTYLRYFPPGLPAGAVPLVMVLHGGTETAEGVSAPTDPRSHWKEIADREQFIVVYPNGDKPDGVLQQWHDCRSDEHQQLGSADDVGFLSALIDEVARSHAVDFTRVYSTGASNGGVMSYRLAFEETERFAAIGAVIANLPVDPRGECRAPDRPITVAIMNGDEDPLMPWDGGCVAPPSCRGTVISAEATRDRWIAHNQASVTPDETTAYPDVVPNDGPSTVTRALHRGAAADVAFFRVAGGGHTVPSTHHTLVGRQNRDIESAEELWTVMKQRTRPGAGPVQPVSVFTDGFESAGFTSGGWQTTGTATVTPLASTNSGFFTAQLPATSSITKTVSTSGYGKVRVRFARRTGTANAYEPGEELTAEWSTDGTSWTRIDAFTAQGFEKHTFTLPPAAAGAASFRLRFRTNASDQGEFGYVDDVEIIGVPASAPSEDVTPPDAPSITAPAQGAKVKSSSVVISGAAEGGARVRVAEGGITIGEATADPQGNWSATVSLPDGAHTIRATATDQAGNTSLPSADRTFEVKAKRE